VKFETILVGVDFTAESLAAIRRSVELAGRGTVRLLHVVDTELLSHRGFLGHDFVDRYFEGLAAEAESTIAEVARDLDPGDARVETSVRRGRPADEIVSVASDCDLVVVGAHVRDAVGWLSPGSVAEEVARRSPAPTLIVRESAEGSTRIERVLVAIDVAEPCFEAIEAGSTLADTFGAKLEAIHVVPSVATKLAQGAPCPVLVVRPKND